jgi:CRP-like cAMP-binding protein
MNKIAGLFQRGSGETKTAGEALFREGTPGTSMYLIRCGEVAIYVGGMPVERIGPGGIVGEMALIDDSPRSASAVALTDCELVPIDRKRFLFLVQETPFFALEVMRVMGERLRVMNRLARVMPRAADAPSHAAEA